MERSSPLAAMQPPSFSHGPWGCRTDAQPSFPTYGVGLSSKLSSNFNFNELSMYNPSTDYFSWRPARGSSPTASLAADLSSNFHIDRSPQLPTPRRSLFTSNPLGAMAGRETTLTPPLPSSPPGSGMETMEISPLPHKQAFVVEREVEPTPVEFCLEDPTPSSPNAMQDSPAAIHRSQMPPPDKRRRPSLLRPSLSRAKSTTTSAVTLKTTSAECPPFRFGSGASISGVQAPNLVDNTPLPLPPFSPSEIRPQSAGSPLAQQGCRPSPPRLTQSTSNLRSIVPQGSCHIRKSNNPLQRPRKQFRRSLSMFEHPQDVMKQEEAQFASTELDPIMDVDDPPRLQLPHFHSRDESLPRISKETMIDVLDGKFGENYDRSLIVDCRFEYEFDGGHIDGAVNHTDKEKLATDLLQDPPTGRTLLIFHCEYSACRAPRMAQHIRGQDRACNAHRYPLLTYPEVYILDGGYSAFYAQHKLRCFPQNYVEMEDKKHELACERGMGRVKQQRSKLSRAQTFAFGQRQPQSDDSPTGLTRQSASISTRLEMGLDSPIITRTSSSRRMVTF